MKYLSNIIFYGTRLALFIITFYVLSFAFAITIFQLLAVYIAWELLFKSNDIPVYVSNLIFKKQNSQGLVELEKLKQQSNELSRLNSEWEKYMEEFK